MSTRVLVVSNMYPTERHPSYGKFVELCVEGLRARGFEVDVCGIGLSSGKWDKFLRYLRFALVVNAKLLRVPYGLVYVHHPLHAMLICGPLLVALGRKVALNFHGDDLIPATYRGRVLQKIVSPFYRVSKVVLVPSLFFKTEFERRFGERAERQVRIFRSGGVANSYFHVAPEPILNRGGLLFLSRFAEGKGWRAFLDVVQETHMRLGAVRATLAGQGEDKSLIKQEIADRGLSAWVSVVEASSPETNRELYQSHRYFVFPTRLPESLALVNLEAMACGCVVISTDFPAAREYIEDGANGFLIPEASFSKACVEIVVSLEGDPGRLSGISKRATEVATTYSESLVLDQLPQLLSLASNARNV